MTWTSNQSRSVSDLLVALAAQNGEGAAVTLGTVAATLGSRAHGFAILILALPEMIPAPLPGLSSVLGVPLVLVSLHLAIFGEGAQLPRRAMRWRVPGRFLSGLARVGAPLLARAERLSRPRLEVIARRERLIGLVCLFWSLVLWLPIPFLNGLPATLLVLLAWGLVQRDGLFVVMGLAGSGALALASMLLGETALQLFRDLGPTAETYRIGARDLTARG